MLDCIPFCGTFHVETAEGAAQLFVIFPSTVVQEKRLIGTYHKCNYIKLFYRCMTHLKLEGVIFFFSLKRMLFSFHTSEKGIFYLVCIVPHG